MKNNTGITAVEMYQRGLSTIDIATVLNRNPVTIWYHIKKAGVVRDRSEAAKLYRDRVGRNGWIDSGYKGVMVDGRRIREHRLVMEKVLGRPLDSTEHVHHINENKLDNRPENLVVVSNKEHAHIHKGYFKEELKSCDFCKSEFKRNHKESLKQWKDKKHCSHSCAAKGNNSQKYINRAKEVLEK